MIEAYEILAYWGPRRETAADCAPRVLRMYEALAKIDPLFESWTWVGRRRPIPMASLNAEKLVPLLEDGQNFSDFDHEPIPSYGYRFSAYNNREGPSEVIVGGNIGGYSGAAGYDNTIELHTRPFGAPDPALVNFRVFRATLLTFAEIWPVSWGYARSYAMPELTPRDPKRGTSRFHGGWLTYLYPPFAAKITPPRSAMVEELPGGALLMIATKDTFDAANPAHVAVARDIEEALAPLNALPWPVPQPPWP